MLPILMNMSTAAMALFDESTPSTTTPAVSRPLKPLRFMPSPLEPVGGTAILAQLLRCVVPEIHENDRGNALIVSALPQREHSQDRGFGIATRQADGRRVGATRRDRRPPSAPS